MKRYLSLICLVLFSIVAMAQAGKLKTLKVDTLKGNNNATLGTIPVTGDYNTLAISVKIDRISTAAGGTLYLKSGLAAASALVENFALNPSLAAYPNDTLATTDVAAQYWNIVIPKPAMTNYYIYGDGDANDTVKVTTSYYLKK